MSMLTGEDKERSPFRKEALDRLSSPERLDRLVTVTRPSAWIALVALALLSAAALVWAFLGAVTTSVSGEGILLNSGGRIYAVVASGAGRLVGMSAVLHQEVREGQVVAHVVDEEMEQRHRNAEAAVAEREAELARQRRYADEETAMKRGAVENRRVALMGMRAAARKREVELARKLADEETLLNEKVVTRQTVLTSRQAVNQATQEAADAANQLAQLDNDLLDVTFRAQQRVRDAEMSLGEARRTAAQTVEARRSQTDIVAPAAGRVGEIQANVGALVRAGENLMTIETPGEGVQLLLFVRSADGDKVKPGMSVLISPADTQREEDGSLLGTVAAVSDFPVTREGMTAVLNNSELVRTFSQDGPPFQVTIDPVRDVSAPGGYRWTSNSGATRRLSSGTPATAEIAVKRRAPITLAVPLLREYTGL